MAEGSQVIINLLVWLALGIGPAALIAWIDWIQEKHERQARNNRHKKRKPVVVPNMRKTPPHNRRHM